MTELRVHNFSVSLDGFGAGPAPTREDPLGVDGEPLHPDVRLGRGVATVHEYLRAGLLDEIHVTVVPVLLRSGERLFEGVGPALEGRRCVEFSPSRAVAHVRLRRDA